MSVCSVPRMGFFEVCVFQQKVTTPVLSGLLLQLGEVALVVCVFCAGQCHTGLGKGPADNTPLVLSPAVSGSDPRQELALQCLPCLPPAAPGHSPPAGTCGHPAHWSCRKEWSWGGSGVSPGFEDQQ